MAVQVMEKVAVAETVHGKAVTEKAEGNIVASKAKMDTEQVIERTDIHSETCLDAEKARVMPTAKVEWRKAIAIDNNAVIKMHGIETVDKNVVEDQRSYDVNIKTTTTSSIDTGGFTCSMCDCWYLRENDFRLHLKDETQTDMMTGLNAKDSLTPILYNLCEPFI